MQAAYLAQHEFNMDQSGTSRFKVRILIDNSGANNDNVARVAQFIKNRVSLGNQDQIVGVIGWPFSAQTIDARDIIASAHIPLISQTASSNLLTGSSPYFFRVNPPDQVQGTTLGKVAMQSMGAHQIFVLRDPTDPYSVSLADTFSHQIEMLQGQAINDVAGFFSEKVTSVQDYQHIIELARTAHADMIFCSCLDVDAIRLAHALGNLERAAPNDAYLQNLKLLGGDGIDTVLLLGLGTGPDADIARQFPQDLQRLRFTAFGHSDEWNFLHVPVAQQPAFFADWDAAYQTSPIEANTATDSTSDVLLTYDAVSTALDAISLVHGPVTGEQLRNALKSLGRGAIPAYQGITGPITFDEDGNPVDKALVLLKVDVVDGQTTIALIQVIGKLR
jgi:ABC-type branched-subunit amino acid transport system substrate-binding protein